jgi:hypothetical protein
MSCVERTFNVRYVIPQRNACYCNGKEGPGTKFTRLGGETINGQGMMVGSGRTHRVGVAMRAAHITGASLHYPLIK